MIERNKYTKKPEKFNIRKKLQCPSIGSEKGLLVHSLYLPLLSRGNYKHN